MKKPAEYIDSISRVATVGYQKIEHGVVSGFRRIEHSAVTGFARVCDRYIAMLFSRENETVAETRARLCRK